MFLHMLHWWNQMSLPLFRSVDESFLQRQNAFVGVQFVLLLCSQPPLFLQTAGESVNPCSPYVCAYWECAGLDPHTLFLIKKLKGSGVCLQHIPVGLQASGVQGLVTVCVCAYTYLMLCLYLCNSMCVYMSLLVYISVNSAAYLKYLHKVFASQFYCQMTQPQIKNNQPNNLSTHRIKSMLFELKLFNAS